MAAATVDEIRVLLRAQTKQFERDMKRAGKTVGKSGKQMEGAAKGATSKFKNLASSVTLVQGPLSGIGARFTAANAIFTRTNVLLAGMVLAFAGLAAGLKTTIGRFSQNERALGRISALIKSTGGAAQLTTDEIDQMAIALDRATLGSRQGFLDAAGVILTFKEISGDAFRRTLEGAADIAEVLGTDVRSAALQLGKALQEPAIGLGMLRRAGISFSPAAKEVINDFVNMGEKAKALDLILEGVEAQIGGAARGAAGGVAGASDDLKASLNDLAITVGAMASEFLRLSEAGKKAAATIDAFSGASSSRALEKALKFETADEGIAKIDALDRIIQGFTARVDELSRKELSLLGPGVGLRDVPRILKDFKDLAAAQRTLSLATEVRAKLVAKLNELESMNISITNELPEKVRKVIKELDRETAALSKTGAELVFFNAMQKAGQKEGSKFADMIRASADAFSSLKARIDEANEALKTRIRLGQEAEDRMLGQAEAAADIIIGQRREVETLKRLITAQRQGNRERRIEERIISRLNEAKDKGVKLTKREIAGIKAKATAIVDLETELEDVTEATVNWNEELKDLNRRALREFQQSIIDVAGGTKSLGDAWRETGRIILNELNKIIVKMIFASNIGESGGSGIFGDILKGVFGLFTGGSSGGGGVSPAIASSTTGVVFGPFQGGGRVTAGEAIIGGERRPELFVPDQPGKVVSRIFPSMLSSGGGDTFVFENNFAIGVAETARREITAAMPQIIDAAVDGMTRKVNLGGREARTVTRKR